MRVEKLQLISRHVPIWAILCGDHALKNSMEKHGHNLLDDPDFEYPLQNKLRYILLHNRRRWLAKTMSVHCSFWLAKISDIHLMSFSTPFEHVDLYSLALKYQDARRKPFGYRYFHLNRDKYFLPELRKSEEDVMHVYKMKRSMERRKKRCITEDTVLNTYKKQNKDLLLALNRCVISYDRWDDEYKIMDGLHRLLASQNLQEATGPRKNLWKTSENMV